MNVRQMLWTASGGWNEVSCRGEPVQPSLVLYFAAPAALRSSRAIPDLVAMFPSVPVVGCSTGGEILGTQIHDGCVAAAVIGFATATCSVASVCKGDGESAFEAGRRLAAAVARRPPKAFFVLADGVQLDGAGVVQGLKSELPPDIVVAGGLAGDGDRFGETLVGVDNDVRPGQLAGIAFYGERLRVGHGCAGGWDAFGPKRIVTRAKGNVVLEIDDEPALDLYCRYLGAEADRLPGSALRFPLRIEKRNGDGSELVRTVVAIDRAARSISVAGDIATGQIVQLMRGKYENLIDGAGEAAAMAARAAAGEPLAILVSCIGRKLLMGQRVGEEVEAVAAALGRVKGMIGFYSYGEMSPHGVLGRCEFHNQTMTIFTIDEG